VIDGSGLDDDFIIAVEEASQSGPLPQPPEQRDASPRLQEIVASPSPRRKTLISPTRPLPTIATANESRGPVPDARKTFQKDRTTAGAPSGLMRASASATPYPPMRLDSGSASREPTPRAATTTKAPMPGPITVQTRTEGSRPIKLDLESEPTARSGKRVTQSRAAETKSDGSVAKPMPRPRKPEERMIDAAVAAAITEADVRASTKGRTLPMESRGVEPTKEVGAPQAEIQRDRSAAPGKPRGTPPPIKEKTDRSGEIRVGAPQAVARDDSSGPTEIRSGRTVVPESSEPAPRRDTPPLFHDLAAPGIAPGKAEARGGATQPASVASSIEATAKKTQPPTEAVVAPIAAPTPASDRSTRTQPALIVHPDGAATHTQPVRAPLVAATPAPVATPIARPTTPPSTSPRKATHRVPNWVAAAVFGLLGLGAGVLIASGAGDDEPAELRPALANASTTPAAEPASKTSPEPAREPVTVEPSTEPPAIDPVPPTTPEVVAMIDDTPSLADDAAADPAPRRRYKRRARAQPVQTSAPDPEPEREPELAAPKPRPKPPSATALLGQARAAYASGNHETAYRLARRSHSAGGSNDALVMMAKAACRNDDKDGALSALRQLPLLERAPIRRDCRKAGSRIGI
jgi:hypothetical protein